MKKLLNGVVAICIIFLVASNAGALVIGEQVRMNVFPNVDHPYQLRDIGSGIEYTSFCLESEQVFWLNPTYDVQSVGDNAINGGGGKIIIDYDSNNNPIYGDPVDDRSRWLYAAFMSGIFSKIDNAAAQVQHAIWYVEEETGGSESDFLNLYNTYYQNSMLIASGWDIVAVNISLNGGDNQSQLIGVAPVPEPATMLLLGTGLIGLAGIGRKKFLQ